MQPTPPESPLFDHDVQRFREQGFLVFRRLVDPATVETLSGHYDKVVARQSDVPSEGLIYIDDPSREVEGWRGLPFYRRGPDRDLLADPPRRPSELHGGSRARAPGGAARVRREPAAGRG